MPELTSTDMARTRTVMAADRTLMAWVRTTLSMISFGFTITKFFQYLQQSKQAVESSHGARNLGLTLTILGVVGVIAAVVQHKTTLKELGITRTRDVWSVTVVSAVIVAIIGGLIFFSAVTESGPF